MARKIATSQVFTVRNEQGERLGTYRAMTAAQAIGRFWDEQAAYGSVFRGQSIKRVPLTAAVEPSPFGEG